MSLFNRPLGQRTMFNPISYYRQRVAIKRDVFNPDKKTLDLQKLNRFVNGTPERLRTKPTYLLAKTRKLLGHTIKQDIDAGKYGEEQKQVATKLVEWCTSPRAADSPKVRHWLKQLAEAKPVERPAVESGKIHGWTFAQRMKDFSSDEGTHVSSEQEVKSSGSPGEVDVFSESDGDINRCEDAVERSIPELDSEDLPELHMAGSDEALSQWVDALDASENTNITHDLFNQVDAEIAGRRRKLAEQEAATRPRPSALLRPPQASRRVDQGVVREVNGQIVPAKQ